jgi:hypothetical protein
LRHSRRLRLVIAPIRTVEVVDYDGEPVEH